MSDIINYNKITITQRSIYDYLLLKNHTLFTDINNSDLMNTGKLYSQRTEYEIMKLLINASSPLINNFYTIQNSTASHPKYVIGNVNNGIIAYILFDENYQINTIKIGKTDFNNVEDYLYNTDKELLSQLTFLTFDTKVKNYKKQTMIVNPNSIAKVFFISVINKVLDNQNIIMSIIDANNKKDIGLSQDMAKFYGNIKRKQIDNLQKYDSDFYQYYNECLSTLNQNKNNITSVKIYEVDSIKDYKYNDKVTFYDITTTQLSNNIESKKIILNSCHVDKIGCHIKCETLQLNHCKVANIELDTLQCNNLIINSSHIPEDFLQQFNAIHKNIIINGIPYNEESKIFLEKEKEKKVSNLIRIKIKDDFNKSPITINESEKKDEFIINSFGFIDSLNFRLYDYLIPDISYHLFKKNQVPESLLYNCLSNALSTDFVMGCLDKQVYKSKITISSSNKTTIDTIVFHNNKASEPCYILTDGSYSPTRNTMLASVILDKEFNIHTIIAGKSLQKIPHEQSSFLLSAKYLNAIGFEDLSQMTWFTDITQKTINDTIKNIDINIETHFGKYKSLASTLFIDGICHQICANQTLSTVLSSPHNYTKAKLLNNQDFQNKHKAYKGAVSSIIRKNLSNIYNDYIKIKINPIKEILNQTIIESLTIVQNKQLNDLSHIKNLQISELKIKNIKDIDLHIEKLHVDTLILENISIQNFAYKISANKIIIKDSIIETLAHYIETKDINIISSNIEIIPMIENLSRGSFINTQENKRLMEEIIKDNPNATIFYNGEIINGILLPASKSLECSNMQDNCYD